jgi:magnesium transporter
MKKEYQIADCRIVEGCTEQKYQISVYINPDKDEKRYLIDDLKIDEHTLNSALDPDELPRLEFEPNHIAIIYKRPQNYSGKDQFLFKVASTGVFLFKDRLVVVLADDAPLFDGKQFTKVSSLNDLLLKMIFRSVTHFLEHLRIINMVSDEIEHKVNTSMENSFLINMFTLEKSLVYYLNAIHSNAMLLDRLKNNAAKVGLLQEELEFLDDLFIENNQCLKQAEIYSNILASLMDARVSIVSNNLNILIKMLNIITIVIMVPTLVVSAFSMNVKIPFQPHPHAFWIILGFAGASALAVMMLWRYKKW